MILPRKPVKGPAMISTQAPGARVPSSAMERFAALKRSTWRKSVQSRSWLGTRNVWMTREVSRADKRSSSLASRKT